MNDYIKLLIALILSIFVAGVLIYTETYSMFGYAMLLADLFVAKLYFIDKYLLKGWDTIYEIKRGNTAAAIVLLAYSIVLLSAVLAAFVVWR